MKAIVSTFLAVSLIGNAALAVILVRRASAPASSAASVTASPASAATTAPTSPAIAHASAPTAPTTTGRVWRAPRTDDDIRNLVANLRAAGCPPTILRAVVDKMVAERILEKRPEANWPFWKRMPHTVETVAAEQALDREAKAMRDALLGADSAASARLDPVDRQRRFGNLPSAKVDALLQLEREYRDLGSVTQAGMGRVLSIDDVREQARQREALQQELQADLAAVLSPEELQAYEMRSSGTASRLKAGLTSIDISEAEYAQLYQAQKVFDAANPESAMISSGGGRDAFAQRQAAQAKMQEQARAVLGDERFFSYLEGTDSQYKQVVQFTQKYPGVSAATAYEIHQLRNEANNPTGINSAEEFAAYRAGLAARLDALLPAEAAAEFKKQNIGRVFNPPTIRPAVSLPGGG